MVYNNPARPFAACRVFVVRLPSFTAGEFRKALYSCSSQLLTLTCKKTHARLQCKQRCGKEAKHLIPCVKWIRSPLWFFLLRKNEDSALVDFRFCMETSIIRNHRSNYRFVSNSISFNTTLKTIKKLIENMPSCQPPTIRRWTRGARTFVIHVNCVSTRTTDDAPWPRCAFWLT